MNTQILGKTKDAVLRHSVLSSVVCICHKKPSPSQTQLTQRRKQRLIQYETEDSTTFYYRPDPSSSFSGIPTKEQVILFTNSGDPNSDQEKGLALSRMYDNILREIPQLLENHDYTIYTDDLEFVSHLPILRTVHGRQSYKVGLTAWFRSLTFLYTDLYINLMEAVKEDDHVSVRWGICGNNRINSSFTRVFDGTSTFYPENTGLIKTHILDRVAVDKQPYISTL